MRPLAIENASSSFVKSSDPWGHSRNTAKKIPTVVTREMASERSQPKYRDTAEQSTAKSRQGSAVTRNPNAATPRKHPQRGVSLDVLCTLSARIDPAVSRPKNSVAPNAAPVLSEKRMTSVLFICVHNVAGEASRWSVAESR